MIYGHGRLVMAVMALVMAVMASLACSVEWSGVPTPAPSMTAVASSTPSPVPSMTATYPPDQCLVVLAFEGDGALNLRTGPGTSYRVLTVLHDGQTLVMDGHSNGWYRVTAVMEGKTLKGWVNSGYVEACP